MTLAGCGKPAEKVPSPGAEAPQALAPPPESPADLSQAGAVKGRVFYEGPAPAPREIPVKGNPECAVFHPGGNVKSEELLARDGFLKNVFVYVKEGLEHVRFDAPQEPVVIDNKNCVYVPHVSGAQVGQPVELRNSDPTLHNVHSYAENSKNWNLGLPFQGMKQVKKFEAAEVMVTLKCDVHPWMIGYLGVLAHPCFQVTGDGGEFELKNLPPGRYLIEAWHEKLGTESQTVEIGPQETKTIEFRFKA
ncbi:MAG: hypothetical protein HYT89_06500 [Candidatus Omnitrophica bacterium]|nr:hypothetical protein [Candidatus Omnitrophota bacterium]